MMLCETIAPPARAAMFSDRMPWSEDDDAKLVSMNMMQPPAPPEKMAAVLGRSVSSVTSRLSRLRIRRLEGGKLRRCMNHRECGHTIYSMSFGERLCHPCRKRASEIV